MATITDLASQLPAEILAVVPWWAWAALLVMIFWGVLLPERDDRPAHPER